MLPFVSEFVAGGLGSPNSPAGDKLDRRGVLVACSAASCSDFGKGLTGGERPECDAKILWIEGGRAGEGVLAAEDRGEVVLSSDGDFDIAGDEHNGFGACSTTL